MLVDPLTLVCARFLCENLGRLRKIFTDPRKKKFPYAYYYAQSTQVIWSFINRVIQHVILFDKLRLHTRTANYLSDSVFYGQWSTDSSSFSLSTERAFTLQVRLFFF